MSSSTPPAWWWTMTATSLEARLSPMVRLSSICMLTVFFLIAACGLWQLRGYWLCSRPVC